MLVKSCELRVESREIRVANGEFSRGTKEQEALAARYPRLATCSILLGCFLSSK